MEKPTIERNMGKNVKDVKDKEENLKKNEVPKQCNRFALIHAVMILLSVPFLSFKI